MRKIRGIPITKAQGAVLLTAFAIALIGAPLLYFGSSAAYVPLRMAAWLHFCVAAVLLLNLLLPALCSLMRKRLETDKLAKERIASNEAAAARPQEAEEACEQGAEGNAEASETPRIDKKVLRRQRKEASKGVLAVPVRVVLLFLVRWSNAIALVLELATLGVLSWLFIRSAAASVGSPYCTYLQVLFLAAAVVVLLVVAKSFKYFLTEGKLKNALISTLDVLRYNLMVLAVGTVVNITGLFAITPVLRVFEYVAGGYCVLFLTISLLSAFIRSTCATGAHLVVPRPFSKNQSDDEEDLVTYLEHSTGITLRSLFGVKVARKILPIVALATVFVFWLTTGITNVDTAEKGVLYRFGKYEKIMEPGLHVTLPYPFDKADIYQTETVQEMVVGYEDSDKTNLLWDESHGGTEYKLLLGGGKELVSVNLRIQYKINDLYKYVTCSAEPTDILNAKAYAVVTELTVNTKLDELLAEDRAVLSQTIEEHLGAYLEESGCGLAVCDVIIESIHPPVEVASVYREALSAELNRDALIYNAKGTAEGKLVYAESSKYTLITEAEIRQQEKVAEATAAVSTFLGMLEAGGEKPSEIYYYKYLAALAEIYDGKRLYIVSEGLGDNYIYFEDGVIIYSGNGIVGN